MAGGRGRSSATTGRTKRAVGAFASSCTGLAGAAAFATTHGSTALAVLIFVVTQAWIAAEWTCQWRLRWRRSNLQEDIVRKALADPQNEDLRTLLIDVAKVYADQP